MTELPRKAAARTARLAALPLGYAGRTAVGFGKRLGGMPAEAVLTEVQMRTAEQLFRTLGELKGGAMKFGQALSVLEAALPDEVIAPYRDHLTRLQDSAPPMPTQTVRAQVAASLGDDWAERLVWLDGGPAAAASIGQVHRGRWHDGREVAVKVQYPGAGEALMSDLRQLARVARGVAPVFPGIDVKPLVEELRARAADALDYTLEAEAQRAYAAAFRDDPDVVVPDVVAVGEQVIVTEWMESSGSLARVVREGTREERNHYGEAFVRFLFAGPARTGAGRCWCRARASGRSWCRRSPRRGARSCWVSPPSGRAWTCRATRCADWSSTSSRSRSPASRSPPRAWRPSSAMAAAASSTTCCPTPRSG
jgi:predicted unusual protein kinase regulating ubiquinone biosynthesis (AarF/ABC1/UbiB family)